MKFARLTSLFLIASLSLPILASSDGEAVAETPNTEDRDKLLDESIGFAGFSGTLMFLGLTVGSIWKFNSQEGTFKERCGNFGVTKWPTGALVLTGLGAAGGGVGYLTSLVGGTWFWAEYGGQIDDINIRHRDLELSYFVDVGGTMLAGIGGLVKHLGNKNDSPMTQAAGTGLLAVGAVNLLWKRGYDVVNYFSWLAD